MMNDRSFEKTLTEEFVGEFGSVLVSTELTDRLEKQNSTHTSEIDEINLG
jgi:hypothetical protein